VATDLSNDGRYVWVEFKMIIVDEKSPDPPKIERRKKILKIDKKYSATNAQAKAACAGPGRAEKI
jgi:hypothetical protein